MSNPTLKSYLLGHHSKHEVFDFVRSKIIEQGSPSFIGNACAYRGDNDCKCAIGHLLTDDDLAFLYERVGDRVNGLLIASLIDIFASHCDAEATSEIRWFIGALQEAHDTAGHAFRKKRVLSFVPEFLFHMEYVRRSYLRKSHEDTPRIYPRSV